MDVNKAILLGRLTSSPESKNLPSGQAIAKFGLATNRSYKTQEGGKKDEAVFHNIVAFGKLADIVMKFLKKGDKVYLEGRINSRKYQDKSGVKKSAFEIIAKDLVMLGGSNNVKNKKAEEAKLETEEVEVDLEKVPF